MCTFVKSVGRSAGSDEPATTACQAPATDPGDAARIEAAQTIAMREVGPLEAALTRAADELETLRQGLDVLAELLASNTDAEHAHTLLGVFRDRAQAAELAARGAGQAPAGTDATLPVVTKAPVPRPVGSPRNGCGAAEVDPAAPYFEIGALALALRETLMNAVSDDDGWVDTVQSAASVAAHIGYLADAGVRFYGAGGQFADGDGWFMGPATRAAVGRARQ